MSDFRTKEPLIFESMFGLRNKPTEVYNKGGLKEAKKYISKEFTAKRAIEVGGETSYIFDVQYSSCLLTSARLLYRIASHDVAGMHELPHICLVTDSV